jgi:hypothetical protein
MPNVEWDWGYQSLRQEFGKSFESGLVSYTTYTVQGSEYKSYTTETGLVFSTISDQAPSFDDFFPDLKPLIGTVDFSKIPYRRSIRYEGNFNWKTM